MMAYGKKSPVAFIGIMNPPDEDGVFPDMMEGKYIISSSGTALSALRKHWDSEMDETRFPECREVGFTMDSDFCFKNDLEASLFVAKTNAGEERCFALLIKVPDETTDSARASELIINRVLGNWRDLIEIQQYEALEKYLGEV